MAGALYVMKEVMQPITPKYLRGQLINKDKFNDKYSFLVFCLFVCFKAYSPLYSFSVESIPLSQDSGLKYFPNGFTGTRSWPSFVPSPS